MKSRYEVHLKLCFVVPKTLCKAIVSLNIHTITLFIIFCLFLFFPFFSLNNNALMYKSNTPCSAFQPRSLLLNVKPVCHTCQSHSPFASQYHCPANCHTPTCLLFNAVSDSMECSVFLDWFTLLQEAPSNYVMSVCPHASARLPLD